MAGRTFRTSASAGVACARVVRRWRRRIWASGSRQAGAQRAGADRDFSVTSTDARSIGRPGEGLREASRILPTPGAEVFTPTSSRVRGRRQPDRELASERARRRFRPVGRTRRAAKTHSRSPDPSTSRHGTRDYDAACDLFWRPAWAATAATSRRSTSCRRAAMLGPTDLATSDGNDWRHPGDSCPPRNYSTIAFHLG